MQRIEPLFPLAAVLVCLLACVPLLTKYPAPGSDEPGFVDPAITLLNHGYLGTTLYEGLVPTMDRQIYWQPPFYFVALAGWFWIFGPGLEQARLFSLACGLTIVWLVYLLARRWTGPWPALAVSVLCAVSYWLTTRAVFARMDVLCVALSLAAVLAYVRRMVWLAGVLAGLAFLTHPLGVVPIATIVAHQALTRQPLRHIRNACTGFVLGGVVWLIYALQNWDAFQLQMALQLARKQQSPPYWYQFWMARNHAIAIGVVAGATAWLAFTRRRPAGSELVVVGTVVAFAAATYAAETGYFLYFFPFGCVALAMAIDRHTLAGLALVGALASEAAILGYHIHRYHHRNYAALGDSVRAVIPPGASVFIGFADVTPYFALVGRNPMRVATPVPLADPRAHGRLAAQSDFIVTTVPDPYLADVSDVIRGHTPLAVIDQGPGYRIAVFAGKR